MKTFFAFLLFFLFGMLAEAQLPTSGYLHGYQGSMLPSLAVSIPISTTTSLPIFQNGLTLVGCNFPAAFTGTTISFKASPDGVTYSPVYNAAGLVSYTVAPSRYVAFVPADLQGAAYLEIVSGSTEAAARNLICSLKGF